MKCEKTKQKARRAKVVAQRILDRGSPIELIKENYGVATEDGRCVGCAITALAVACDRDFLKNKIALGKKEPELPRSCLGGERARAIGMHKGVFDVVNKKMFEIGESSSIIVFFDGNHKSEYKKRYRRLKTTKSLLNVICKNIVDNNGYFVVEDLKAKK